MELVALPYQGRVGGDGVGLAYAGEDGGGHVVVDSSALVGLSQVAAVHAMPRLAMLS